jgi:hypothetical protein
VHRPVPLLPMQQGPPRSPHLPQVPPLQRVLGAVHAPPDPDEQQARPGPPQLPHAPALHRPPPRPTHDPPGAMQIPDTQQPPLLHAFPAQHGVPGAPHVPVAPPPPAVPPVAPGSLPSVSVDGPVPPSPDGVLEPPQLALIHPARADKSVSPNKPQTILEFTASLLVRTWRRARDYSVKPGRRTREFGDQSAGLWRYPLPGAHRTPRNTGVRAPPDMNS